MLSTHHLTPFLEGHLIWELPISKTLWDTTCMSDHQYNLQLVKKDFDFIETICGFFQGLIFYMKKYTNVYTPSVPLTLATLSLSRGPRKCELTLLR